MADEPVTTGRNQDGTFAPGVSGNPNGRPKSSRHKLSEDFCRALMEDFAENGAIAIQIMRAEKPNEYARMIASILPKEEQVEHSGGLTINKVVREIVKPKGSDAP